ncbi:hypothetical protein E2C01_088196 [Portunus trituberculatus]|uniref:Uncharacterized protein n=1 Tax=Portunus trituberculatus TaxID=210409 RepID=A0A5B7J8K2_PORTR|nr:hypothetical protein [Portunus trituberculatus]
MRKNKGKKERNRRKEEEKETRNERPQAKSEPPEACGPPCHPPARAACLSRGLAKHKADILQDIRVPGARMHTRRP